MTFGRNRVGQILTGGLGGVPGGLKPSLIISSWGNFEGGSPSTASISSSVTLPLIVAAKIAAATCGAGGGHGASCGVVESERFMVSVVGEFEWVDWLADRRARSVGGQFLLQFPRPFQKRLAEDDLAFLLTDHLISQSAFDLHCSEHCVEDELAVGRER